MAAFSKALVTAAATAAAAGHRGAQTFRAVVSGYATTNTVTVIVR